MANVLDKPSPDESSAESGRCVSVLVSHALRPLSLVPSPCTTQHAPPACVACGTRFAPGLRYHGTYVLTYAVLCRHVFGPGRTAQRAAGDTRRPMDHVSAGGTLCFTQEAAQVTHQWV